MRRQSLQMRRNIWQPFCPFIAFFRFGWMQQKWNLTLYRVSRESQSLLQGSRWWVQPYEESHFHLWMRQMNSRRPTRQMNWPHHSLLVCPQLGSPPQQSPLLPLQIMAHIDKQAVQAVSGFACKTCDQNARPLSLIPPTQYTRLSHFTLIATQQ